MSADLPPDPAPPEGEATTAEVGLRAAVRAALGGAGVGAAFAVIEAARNAFGDDWASRTARWGAHLGRALGGDLLWHLLRDTDRAATALHHRPEWSASSVATGYLDAMGLILEALPSLAAVPLDVAAQELQHVRLRRLLVASPAFPPRAAHRWAETETDPVARGHLVGTLQVTPEVVETWAERLMAGGVAVVLPEMPGDGAVRTVTGLGALLERANLSALAIRRLLTRVPSAQLGDLVMGRPNVALDVLDHPHATAWPPEAVRVLLSQVLHELVPGAVGRSTRDRVARLVLREAAAMAAAEMTAWLEVARADAGGLRGLYTEAELATLLATATRPVRLLVLGELGRGRHDATAAQPSGGPARPGI